MSKGAHERARGSARAGFFLECARKSTTGTSGAVLWQMVIKSRRDGCGGWSEVEAEFGESGARVVACVWRGGGGGG